GDGGSFQATRNPGIDRQVGVGIKATVPLDKAVTFAGCFEAGAIEYSMAHRKRAEQPIKKKKTDAEVGAHPAVLVDGVMVNVVQTAGGKEAAAEKRMACHQEVGEVHTVVQIVEGEDGPGDQRGHRNELIEPGYAEQRHHQPDGAEQRG